LLVNSNTEDVLFFVLANCFKIIFHYLCAKSNNHFMHYVPRVTISMHLLYLVNAYCRPHLLHGSERIKCSSTELSSTCILYSFNSVLCKYIKLTFGLPLPGRKTYCVTESICHLFLCKAAVSKNMVIKHIFEWFRAV